MKTGRQKFDINDLPRARRTPDYRFDSPAPYVGVCRSEGVAERVEALRARGVHAVLIDGVDPQCRGDR